MCNFLEVSLEGGGMLLSSFLFPAVKIRSQVVMGRSKDGKQPSWTMKEF